MAMNRCPIFVINLDRVPERFEFVRSEFRDAGVEVIRWPAVDAAHLTEAVRAHYLSGDGPQWELTDTVIACFESHRRIWEHVVAEGIDQAIVLEDDILFTAEAGRVLTELCGRKPDYDILKLDSTPQKRRFGTARPFMESFELRPLLQAVMSSAAYAVSLEGARKLLAASQTYCHHADIFIFTPRPGWTTLQLVPAIGCQGMHMPEEDDVSAIPDVVASSERTSDPALNTTGAREPFGLMLKRKVGRELSNLRWLLGGRIWLLASGGMVGRVPLSSPIRR